MDKQSASCYSTHMTTDTNQPATRWYARQAGRTSNQAAAVKAEQCFRLNNRQAAWAAGQPYLP